MEGKIAVARCHEIQMMVRDKEVHRFEGLTEIGLAVHLALHIRALPVVDYGNLKLVATAILGIPKLVVDRIVMLLAEIGFVRIHKQGNTIKSIVPTVPYYEEMYEGIAEFAKSENKLDEFERLTIEIVDRLATTPANQDALANQIGADRAAFDESVSIGTQGNFLIARRARSKNILLNPNYFSENADIFSDAVAGGGAGSVARLYDLLKIAQGWPLPLIIKTGEIRGHKLSADEVSLLKRLAQDGAVKPPSITTPERGDAQFMFTPTPGFVKVNPLRRDIYERGLAVVSAVRLGQLLPNKFAIRSPGAVLHKLKSELKLNPTSDYSNQYKNLVHMRIATLENTQGSFWQLKIIDTPENREALQIAYDLVRGGGDASDFTVDQDAVNAMTNGQDYVESLISSRKMREREHVPLSEEMNEQLELLLLGGHA